MFETLEEEQSYIAKLKAGLKGELIKLGGWKDSENAYSTVYALQELALEISPSAEYFEEVANETMSVAEDMPDKIFNNY